MMRSAQVAVLLVILSVCWITGAAAQERMAVKVDIANIRALPDTTSDTLWQVERYYPLLVIEKKGQWYRVKDFEGDAGWINRSLLDDTPTVIVKVNRANIRMDAGTRYDMAFDADKGTPFKVLENKDRWIKIQHADGDIGWVFKPLVW